ncbi:MAG TPA: ABC transporter permease [Hyphomonadaceae bacterium]|jgi:putative ABC transport system permease protein|nr:ABC transporter permease [Hyphomonadaceae bacterium]
MIGRHISGAFGRIVRAPVSTGANILTLALGLAAFILAWGVMAWWQSSDGHFANSPRIQVMTQKLSLVSDGRSSGASSATSEPLAKYLREDFPGLEAVARLRGVGEISVKADGREIMLYGANADPGFLRIFDFKFLAGDPVRALEAPDGLVLAQKAAEKLFGNAPALGRRLTLNGQRDVTVTGVIAPIPKPTSMGDVDPPGVRFDYVSAWPAPASAAQENWLSLQYTTYALLPADGSLTPGAFRQRLAQLDERRVPAAQLAIATVDISSFPISELQARRLDVELFGGFSSGLSVTQVLLGLGIMVLGVACLNYANLATAQAVSRFKQVGMRKVLGASRNEIVTQTFAESALLTVIALGLALLGCWLAAPVVHAQTGIDLGAVLFRDPRFVLAAALLAVVVAVAAGAYPAIALSRIRPADALRTGKSRSGPRFVSHTLVGLQFATASILLIAVLVLGQQNAFLRQAFGASRDPVVVLDPGTLTGVTAEKLKQALGSRQEIRQVSSMDHLPWSTYSNVAPLARSPEAGSAEYPVMVTGVGFGYFEAFSFKVLAGRVYDESRDKGAISRAPGSSAPRDPSRATDPLMIDRALAATLGFASPQAAVGQVVYIGASTRKLITDRPPFEIIGVVENSPQHFMGAGTTGNAYGIDDGAAFYYPVIRIARGQESQAMAAIQQAWGKLASRPFNPRLASDLFEQGFKRFDQTGNLFRGLSLLAFLISATGLFGIAVHVIQRRRHEIGVRKTLGSTAWRVVVLLTRDFSRPVVIANLLAWPIGYLVAQAYLSSFMRRVDLTLTPFVLSFVITLGIAWIVVGAQTVRAANLRPADVLRRA